MGGGVIAEPIEVIVGLSDDQALELLNTRAMPSPGMQVELIGDGRAYLTWLTRTGLIGEPDRATIEAEFSPEAIDDVASTARELREQLRIAVTAWIDDPSVAISSDVADRLNTVMQAGQRFTQLQTDDQGVLEVRDVQRWTHPTQLLVPVAEAWARLLTAADTALIHQCPTCTIIFYDRTKAHTRRWCSMALCGNRAKVRRHRKSNDDERSSGTPGR